MGKIIRVGDRLIGEADVGAFYSQHGAGKCIPISKLEKLMHNYRQWGYLVKDTGLQREFERLERLIK